MKPFQVTLLRSAADDISDVFSIPAKKSRGKVDQLSLMALPLEQDVAAPQTTGPPQTQKKQSPLPSGIPITPSPTPPSSGSGPAEGAFPFPTAPATLQASGGKARQMSDPKHKEGECGVEEGEPFAPTTATASSDLPNIMPSKARAREESLVAKVGNTSGPTCEELDAPLVAESDICANQTVISEEDYATDVCVSTTS